MDQNREIGGPDVNLISKWFLFCFPKQMKLGVITLRLWKLPSLLKNFINKPVETRDDVFVAGRKLLTYSLPGSH